MMKERYKTCPQCRAEKPLYKWCERCKATGIVRRKRDNHGGYKRRSKGTKDYTPKWY